MRVALHRAVVVALALSVAACGRGCRNDGPTGGGSGAASASSASATGAEARATPVSLQGSAIALTPDESMLVIADEDHEALFVVPSSLSGSDRARVIALPGPPAQIVALDGLVLATVRTLPTDDARVALDRIRGPRPGALAAAPAPSGSDAKASAPAASGASRTASRPDPVASALARKRGTPVRPFDPAVVRRSRGGLLLFLRADPAAGLVEVGRVVVAPDAWGLAVTPDFKRALVTSAWSAEATLVDVPGTKAIATVRTSREPRGVAIAPDGKVAYVSHLVGAGLTKLAIMGDRLEASAVALPAAPARTPLGVTLDASLGYALVFSPDAASLYVPRHALGAEGVGAWWGAPTVDVLDLSSGKPVAPFHRARSPGARVSTEHVRPAADWEASPGQAPAVSNVLVQPRAAVYRRSRDTLLVASEGWDALAEVDALAADPAMAVTRVHPLAPAYDPFGGFPDQGGAPTGVALTRDDAVAYVYCRTTFDVVRVDLDSGRLGRLHLADDGLPADAAYGRRLYTNARNAAISGGLGCAACHPEGRDDGYVWRESGEAGDARFIGLQENAKLGNGFEARPPPREVFPRQTPMLAGRVRANGPFGWHAENADILDRLLAGFQLHRAAWDSSLADRTTGEHVAKIDYLADYLRSGLVPPPTLAREPSAIELHGKAVFETPRTGCTRCHVPGTEYTDRSGTALRGLPVRAGFDAEAVNTFKTPSLWFVGGTAPYFHDGSARTLEDLVRTNGDRMGDTRHLTPEEQAALVAYLRIL